MGRKPKPQDEKTEHRVYTYLSSPLKERFEELARLRGVGAGTLLRTLIERELEEGDAAHAARVLGASALRGLSEAGFVVKRSGEVAERGEEVVEREEPPEPETTAPDPERKGP